MIPIENVELYLDEVMPDFYVIRKITPIFYRWMERCPEWGAFSRCMNTSRLGYMDADVEGTSGELLDIAAATANNLARLINSTFKKVR